MASKLLESVVPLRMKESSGSLLRKPYDELEPTLRKEEPLAFRSALYVYLWSLADHYRIGRDFVRLLQDLVRVPEFQSKKDLLDVEPKHSSTPTVHVEKGVIRSVDVLTLCEPVSPFLNEGHTRIVLLLNEAMSCNLSVSSFSSTLESAKRFPSQKANTIPITHTMKTEIQAQYRSPVSVLMLASAIDKVTSALCVKCSQKQLKLNSRADENRKSGKKEHHLWQKRDSAGSGQKALNLVRIVSELPNEKEAVYGALDKWTAWETEFPLIAAAKALKILRQRRQWTRVIQVAKWMLSKGQGATLGTYDTLLLAFDKDDRVDEAKSLWNMIIHTHTRSMSKRLFSRMISLYDHHNMQDEIIEVFADMEELGVRPDEDTVWRVARAFKKLGQEEKRELVLERYQCKWKYIHFNGERVRVKRDRWNEE
ncbi:LOW QUALITY PROTEIN: hypothetical protein NC653_027514 [Populus alba x Populus x berolinensis]|uniref:Pentatricopeptide repeat-containing protein n=1 Tax=Populus alba x Populus x berolinensis TaxID=444605 RepID=A0AAD6M815_9ROSI|nr:LOW QUALITY PROTEIN: hypothetical protein NC653_027514 [Populus alba x Populus x berolinensis]